MIGNKIKMPNNLMDGLVEYADGTESTADQMAKDVNTFLAWAAEPEFCLLYTSPSPRDS